MDPGEERAGSGGHVDGAFTAERCNCSREFLRMPQGYGVRRRPIPAQSPALLQGRPPDISSLLTYLGSLSASMLPETRRSDREEVLIGGVPFRLDEDARASSGVGVLLSTGASCSLRPSQRSSTSVRTGTTSRLPPTSDSHVCPTTAACPAACASDGAGREASPINAAVVPGHRRADGSPTRPTSALH